MPLKILLTEDNPMIYGIMADLLRGEGHQVDVATNGIAAVECLEQKQDYDLILLDLHLPRLSGLDVLARIRAMPNYAHVPVLMLSGEQNEEWRRECLEAGATEFLCKPVSPVALIDLVERYERRKHWLHDDGELGMLLDVRVIENLSRVLPSREHLHRILRNFIQSVRDNMHALRRAAAAGEEDQCRMIVHGIKGAGGTLGAQRLIEQCALMEGMDAKDLRASLDALERIADDTVHTLETLMRKGVV
ncbi:MAG: response regulator [Zetaproteobacteria bacterium]|nr:MAG: response regulator [Zetaproteobacteria bacterium]